MWGYVGGLLYGTFCGIIMVIGFRLMHASTALYGTALIFTSVIAISCAFWRWGLLSSKNPTNEVTILARTRAQLYAGVLAGISSAWTLVLVAGIFLRSVPTGL